MTPFDRMLADREEPATFIARTPPVAHMPSRTVLLAGLFLIVIVGGSAYYLYSNSTNSPANTLQLTINIRGDGTDYFDPANVTLKQGETVTILVFNTDDNTHGLVIPGLNVDSGIIQGSHSARLTFTATTVGAFPFNSPPSYCTGGVGNVCNSAQDLTGTLTVTP